MTSAVRHYLVITGSYWGFTLTDGAIRMLVVLYFHQLGYSAFDIAMLFLFYEFFGIVTNLVGGWLGARIGLNLTMHLGMGLQILALAMLAVPESWLSVAYVMSAQALSGIAKDLNKMSAKASIKTLLPDKDNATSLFKWIAILTGSKNALKGLGFFLGALLLQTIGFKGAVLFLSVSLLVILVISFILLPSGMGKSVYKQKFTQIFSNTAAINWLAAARFFLFGARDIWFVVALPVFLFTNLQWEFMSIGAFLAVWIIGYGITQSMVPRLLYKQKSSTPCGYAATRWALTLAIIPGLLAYSLTLDLPIQLILITGLTVFGIVFAINSVIHSYLIIAYAEHDTVSMNVGFYYMANASGRLMGTVLSGWIYQDYGMVACLTGSAVFLLIAGLLALKLPVKKGQALL